MTKHVFNLVDELLEYNGIPILRKYKIASISTKDSITIHNIFDVKDTLIRGAKLEDFIINGKTYTSFSDFCKESMNLFFFLVSNSVGESSSIPDLQKVVKQGNRTDHAIEMFGINEEKEETNIIYSYDKIYANSISSKKFIIDPLSGYRVIDRSSESQLSTSIFNFNSHTFSLTPIGVYMNELMKKSFKETLDINSRIYDKKELFESLDNVVVYLGKAHKSDQILILDLEFKFTSKDSISESQTLGKLNKNFIPASYQYLMIPINYGEDIVYGVIDTNGGITIKTTSMVSKKTLSHTVIYQAHIIYTTKFK